ncbi:MAG: hypothetical protein KatS3mg002_0904 [Candidatus Woesearchaeota archaeon]|nr:MAG: hypothetical protein KatS3mg002_0904 [Candidatus Woesearchaeota archaeon]
MIKYLSLIFVLAVVILSACTTQDVLNNEELIDKGTTVEKNNNDLNEKTYISKNPQECMVIKFVCEENKKPFFDKTGCGCELELEGKLKAIECPSERPTVCTKEYMPVCAQVQVQCIKAPCPPIKQTYPNKCEACANQLTISYTEGECEQDFTSVTVIGDENQKKESLCTNIGGVWTGYDCENISPEKCQEIGGTFNECASACRNNPNAEICTLQCVPICIL